MVGMLESCASATAHSSSDNHLEAVFTEAISNYLDEVEQLEETIGKDASVTEAECIIQPYRERVRNGADCVQLRERGSSSLGRFWTISTRLRHGSDIKSTAYSRI